MDFNVLEGVYKPFVVSLQDSEGKALDAALYEFSGGAECGPGRKVDMVVVSQDAERVLLHLQPLWRGPRVSLRGESLPWRWQLRAVERATGRVFVLAAGEVQVEAWRGATEPAGGEAAEAAVVEAVLSDSEVVEVKVLLSGGTEGLERLERCVLHVDDAAVHLSAEQREGLDRLLAAEVAGGGGGSDGGDGGGELVPGMTDEERQELERCVLHVEDEAVHLSAAQSEGLRQLLSAGSVDSMGELPAEGGSFNALMLPAAMVPHGVSVAKVVLPAVTNSNAAKPCWLAVYSEMAGGQKVLLGTSTAAVSWAAGDDVCWVFSPAFVVPEDAALVLYLAAGLDAVGASDVARPGVHVAAHVKNEGSGAVRYDGMWYNSRSPFVRFVLGGHVADEVAHLSAAEHEGLKKVLDGGAFEGVKVDFKDLRYAPSLTEGATVAIGWSASASGEDAVALRGTAVGTGAVALRGTASGEFSLAVGNAMAQGDECVALGSRARAYGAAGKPALAVGPGAWAGPGVCAAAFGVEAKASDNGVCVLGAFDAPAGKKTWLYLITAGCEVSQLYLAGEAGIGYVVTDVDEVVVHARGCRRLSALLTEHGSDFLRGSFEDLQND